MKEFKSFPERLRLENQGEYPKLEGWPDVGKKWLRQQISESWKTHAGAPVEVYANAWKVSEGGLLWAYSIAVRPSTDVEGYEDFVRYAVLKTGKKYVEAWVRCDNEATDDPADILDGVFDVGGKILFSMSQAYDECSPARNLCEWKP